jgi:hypothetical protein
MMTCMVIVLLDSILHWRKVMRGAPIAEPVIEAGD